MTHPAGPRREKRIESDEPRARRQDGRSWGNFTPIVVVLLIIGAGLRSAQYFGQVGLWADEIAVARNIEERGMRELLTEPLDYDQVAPVGFLAAVEVSSAVLGNDELGLRFVPWLLGLASLLLFWRVAARFAEGPSLLAVVTLFVFSPALAWYGASVKPYGSDLTISLLLVWLTLRHLERPGDARQGAVGGVLGAAALLTSFSAVPTAAILAALLGIACWRRSRSIAEVPGPSEASTPRPLVILLIGWGIGIGGAAFTATRLVDDATDAYMRDFWAERFPPAELSDALAWAADTVFEVFSHSLVFIAPSDPIPLLIVTLPLALAAVGLVRVGRRSWIRGAILLTPPMAGLAAAALHLLPFGQRLGLHASWPFLVLAGAGLQALHARGGSRWIPRALAAGTALPLALIVLLTARPPHGGASARDVLQRMAPMVRDTDRVYVFGQAGHDMEYYGARAGIDRWIRGRTHYGEPRAYLREIDELRGEPRIWLVWTILGGRGEDDPALIDAYLTTIGRELQRIEDPPAGAVLYDLSDSEKLDDASAETFPIPAGI